MLLGRSMTPDYNVFVYTELWPQIQLITIPEVKIVSSE